MIKVLVVDDEIFTREGIITEIPWSKLGITELEQAYDGINALEVAEKFKPDILITDVRMPRMNGIELSFKLREKYPTCEIIFLSGYSDKEYLKSAIKLKALSYVEKPIDLQELQIAIQSAIDLKIKETENRKNVKNNIALRLINKNDNITNLSNYIGIIPNDKLEQTNFMTILINIFPNEEVSKEDLLLHLEKIINKAGFNSISCYKENSLILLHLYWITDKGYLYIDNILENIFLSLSEYLKEFTTFFICIGKKVLGITDIPDSYNTALETLNKTFFYDNNSIIYYHKLSTSKYKFDENIIENFSKYLSNEDKQNSILLINRLTYEIKECAFTPINFIKDIYYKLLLKLLKFSSDRNLDIDQEDLNSESPFEYLSNLSTLIEIKVYMVEKIEIIFKAVEEKNMNINPILSILKYIHANYSDVNLSLQSISNKTYLTNAYMCSIFKEQTGKTINTYITEYRIIKAKELLKDQNMKIVDITAKVGYSDGNYFTKIFKKETGLTPSEYKKKFFS